ncbi:M56 family metallopeptidase [Anaerotignum sp. MB30-C6]|uniref:M56 family metallopeptidase n=1 Tax=Anaerotignum sp. MB30-C6 TaxID=3070814 RepID=UPI0027DD6B9F|nr:M56 family metallopeptidase [Anaerotignum sp. MB30-C6]WMI79884.1 M56 family metallopeptidase [Anaerotignum sp. MB30-C6]
MNYLYMNASAAAIIIVTLLIRKVTINKIPHSVYGLLWGLATVRMIIPFNVTSNWCVYNIIFKFRDYFFANEIITLQYNGRQILQLFSRYVELDFIMEILFVIWVIGFIIVGNYFIMSYLIGMRLIRNSVVCDGAEVEKIEHWLKKHNLRMNIEFKVSKEIDVPLAYGCIKPGVLLPTEFNVSNEVNAKQIMLHEFMHIKYRHALIKLVLAVLLSSCWFNPCAWILFKYINRDMEISCDRHALELLGGEQRESYALNLLKASQMQYRDSVVYNGFAKNSIKERIVAIMSFKKMSVFALVLSFSIPASVATVFATTDNRFDGNYVSDLEVVEEVGGYQVYEEVFVTMNESELATYTDKSVVTRAARDIYIDDYEHITTYRSPDTIVVKFTDSGYTYKGTLSLTEMKVQNGKYYGYYRGWTARQ